MKKMSKPMKKVKDSYEEPMRPKMPNSSSKKDKMQDQGKMKKRMK